MMDDFLLYSRLVLHLITFAFLVSYRTRETRKPLISLLAATFSGVSLACAAHIVLRPPQGDQLIATLATLAGAVLVVRCGGNLGRALRWGKAA